MDNCPHGNGNDCDLLDITVVHRDAPSRPGVRRFYVGRPGPLGNPFTHLPTRTLAKYRVATRDEAVEKYREWITPKLYKDTPESAAFGELVEWMTVSCAMELACWCAPQRCHGDILRELVLEDDWLYK